MSTNKVLTNSKLKKYKKANIPKALREQVWLKYIGSNFEAKCIINWCKNRMTVFDFHVAHNIPESNGGNTDINNLRPLCARCNLSMGNKYTITQWASLGIHHENSNNTQHSSQQVTVTSHISSKKSWWICC